MTSAAVGFQCPECVREGAKSVRQARTIGGGLVRGGDGVVTRAIVLGTVGVFILQVISGAVTRELALVDISIAAGQWWRLVTVALVHGSVLHVAFNMYALWVVGQQVEIWLGRSRYIALYVLSALAGGASSFAFGAFYSVGASGAIFGVFGALAVLSRKLGYDMRTAVTLIVINLVLTFTFSGIDWHAHVGGLIAGTLLTIVFAYSPAAMRNAAAVGGSVVIVVVALGLTAVHTQHLRNDPTVRPLIDNHTAYEKRLDTNVLGGGL
jgi:membrane associated rhomboid family serine protease